MSSSTRRLYLVVTETFFLGSTAGEGEVRVPFCGSKV